MKKFFKKLWKIVTNKVFLTALFLLVQIAFIVAVIFYMSFTSVGIYILFSVFSLLACLTIISRDENPAYKLAWVVPILALPFFGGFLYVFLGRRKLSVKTRKRMEAVEAAVNEEMTAIKSKEENLNYDEKKISAFIRHSAFYPVFDNTETIYYDVGEKYFEALAAELEKAEKFIFMEYFIIERGTFWDTLLEILEKKVAAGVEVRVMYDDVGCLFTLPGNYERRLRNAGIQTSVFNKIHPSLDVRIDRKSVV